jgi:hypothetical protein
MAGALIAGVRFSIERLHAHARHQPPVVFPPAREPLPIELVAQHARAHERVFQVQRVQATHHCQIGRADRFVHIVDAASANPCQRCLAADRQCAQQSHLAERPF